MTADTAGRDEPPGDQDRERRTRLDGLTRLGAAAVVVVALVVVALTTPPPREAPGSSTLIADPTGTVASRTATPAATPTQPSRQPATATPSPPRTSELINVLRGLYGSGMAADSKANLPVGPVGRVSHRFRASTSSALVALRFAQRGGLDGYSGGSGGSMRISLQEDASGEPSGRVLAELLLEPGNPEGDWTRFDRLDFPSPATLTRGSIYHVVYENVDPLPLENYISVNDLFVYDESTLSRPPGLGPEFATFDEEGGRWDEQQQYTPVLDLVYADGTHDGQSYIQALVDNPAFAVGSLRARQWFVVAGGDRLVESVSVRVRRTFGEGPLTILLETAEGEALASVDVPADQVRLGVPGDFDEDRAEVWAEARFAAPLTLTEGVGYNLVLLTDDDTEYSSIPLREGTVEGMESYRFLDGNAQQTYDGGAVWLDLFELAPADLQFFFR